MQVELTNLVGLIIVVSLISLIGVGTGYIEIITRILRKCGCLAISDFSFRCCKKQEEPEPPKEKVVSKKLFALRSFTALCCAAALVFSMFWKRDLTKMQTQMTWWAFSRTNVWCRKKCRSPTSPRRFYRRPSIRFQSQIAWRRSR